ncbi:hypothetical protein [Halarcobacter ebronensis]|uniref:hypothetical protein n=1 Tax=Halarcobacter ebronensis TaxID=1462615 RepID=UPI003C7801F9
MKKLIVMYSLAAGVFVISVLIFLDIICIEKDKIFLLSSVGIIISAFIASFTLLVSIDENKKLKEDELLKSRYREYNYMLHIIIKIYEQNKLLLNDIETRNLIHKSKSFNLIVLSNSKFINKLDSKDFFFYLPKDKSGKLMNIIARLSTVSNIIEVYKNETDLNEMLNKIKIQLIDHPMEFSLLPFLEDLIKYLRNETNNTKL